MSKCGHDSDTSDRRVQAVDTFPFVLFVNSVVNLL